MTAQEIFKEYSDKYPFLKDLSKQEQSIIICMMHESFTQNNNNWIKIESEDDLPKEYIKCKFITKYSENTVKIGYYSKSDNKFYDTDYYEIEEVTHYKLLDPQTLP